MVDLNKGLMTGRDGKWTRIVRWEVWFQTHKGLAQSYDEGARACREADFEPELLMFPVPVAIGGDGHYEVVLRKFS